MARALWKGVISFGMVSIPISLATATTEHDLHFHQVHKKCGSRIKYQKWCPVDEEVVPPDEIVKGYEVSKGHVVLLEEKDLANLPIPSMHAIEVVAFVEIDEIDPIYFDTTYYVEPTEAGMKPYALLVKALEKKKRVGIAKIALRSKENLCLLRVHDGKILCETLFYPDEIREAPDVHADKTTVGDKELNMAESLIDLLSEKFEPEKYKDEYREALMARIQEKVEGGEIHAAAEAPKATEVIDLMDALKQSLEAAKEKRQSS